MKLFSLRAIGSGAAVAALAAAAVAYAAPQVNYNANFTATLSSPAIDFIIVSGSVADAVVIGTSSVRVTMNVDSGGSFSLTSASRDLMIDDGGISGGTVTKGCTSGTASTTITQTAGTTHYTITAGSAQCGAVASTGVGANTGGGGGGGGGGYTPPPPAPATTSTPSSATSTPLTPAPANLIQPSLSGTSRLGASASPVAALVTKILAPGSRDAQVAELQKLLAQDATIYPEGQITGFYGTLTRKAVERFQKKYGIVSSGTPATTGYGKLGPRTLKKLKEVYGAAPPAASTTPAANAPLQTRIQELQRQLQELLKRLGR